MASGVPRTTTATATADPLLAYFASLSLRTAEQANQQVAIPESRRGSPVASSSSLLATLGAPGVENEQMLEGCRYLYRIGQSLQALRGEPKKIEASNIALRGQIEQLALLPPSPSSMRAIAASSSLAVPRQSIEIEILLKIDSLWGRFLALNDQLKVLDAQYPECVAKFPAFGHKYMQDLNIVSERPATPLEVEQCKLYVLKYTDRMVTFWNEDVEAVRTKIQNEMASSGQQLAIEGPSAQQLAIAGPFPVANLSDVELSILECIRGPQSVAEFRELRTTVARLEGENGELRKQYREVRGISSEAAELRYNRAHVAFSGVLSQIQEMQHVLSELKHVFTRDGSILSFLNQPKYQAQIREFEYYRERYALIQNGLQGMKEEIETFIQECKN